MLKKFFSSIFLLCFCTLVHAQQPTKDDLQKQKKQLEQEMNQLIALEASISKNKKESLKQLAVVKAKIKKREQYINAINKDIKRVEDQVYTNELAINRLKRELDTLKQNYAKSIVFAYKNRSNYEYLNFIFSASDFNDAITRITYLKSYRQYRETQVETINKTQNLLQSAVQTLNTSKVEKKQILQTQSSQLKALELDKKQNAQVVNQLKDQEKEVQAQLKKREKQRVELNKALTAAIKREVEEATRKAKQRAAEEQKKATVAGTPKSTENKTVEPATGGVAGGNRNNRPNNVFESTPEGVTESINFENNKGRLPWPVNGGLVTHEFGVQQLDKQLREKNDGIIISVPIGANVKCVADGEVASIISLDDDQAVMVKHGKYFTIYSKLAHVNVSEGQKVNAGTVVGKAAPELAGNGGEIEFRIMLSNSQFTNPTSWLKPR
jgi:septal ring factor EnvC (AmiA/AmiB activator)